MIDKLRGKIPSKLLAELPMVIQQFGIDTPMKLAHFLAQTSHESGGFQRTVESFAYSSADRLLAVFPRDFKSLADAKSVYDKGQPAMANRVYASQNGNGDEASGDGWKYKGRGFIQLTGRSNYTAFDNAVSDDIVANPELVATKYPLLSAAWWWKKNGLNEIASRGSDQATVVSVTKRVNGGTHGLRERTENFANFYELLK